MVGRWNPMESEGGLLRCHEDGVVIFDGVYPVSAGGRNLV